MVFCTFGMIVFLDFFIFVLRLQWAKKLGWLFLAVGGRSSMENDCWLQRWVALTLGISYGSHPLTSYIFLYLPISSYIFLYLPTCLFCFNGCHAQRPVTCQSLGQLGPSEIRRAQAYWHRGFGSLHRDREEGKNRKDCFGYRKRTLKIHEYTWIYVHITYSTWIMNLKWLEKSWRYLRSLCLMLFACVYLLYNLARRLIAGLASDVRHGAHGQSLGRAESCWVLLAVGSG